ncbi:MAG: adenylate/guanylate cyclase domain-containing protein [Acidimicrobiia bacterium]
MDKKLIRTLRRLGASDAEISRAAEEGWLTLLVLDKTLRPGMPRYDRATVAAQAGVDPDVSRRLWRALGFPDVPDDVPVFTDSDVEALTVLERRRVTTIVGLDDDPMDALVEQARVFSAALAKVAATLTDELAAMIRAARASGLSDERIALTFIDEFDWPALLRLFDYTLRLQARDSLWRKLANEDPEAPGARVLTIGFVDLVGYTAISQQLDPHELSALVRRFEHLAFDTVAEEGGRVVKTIGDEVMFVSGDVPAAARIGRRLTDRSLDDVLLPPARAGLAYGSVVTREGDYFGPVVNLASRLVEIAKPGSVIASDEVHAALVDDPTFAWKRLRSRRIRDIGRVEIWALAAVDRLVETTDAEPVDRGSDRGDDQVEEDPAAG